MPYDYTLSSPYIEAAGSAGRIASLRFDPSGTSTFGANIVATTAPADPQPTGFCFTMNADDVNVIPGGAGTTSAFSLGGTRLTLTMPVVNNLLVQQHAWSNGAVVSLGPITQTFVMPTGSDTLAGIGVGLYPAYGLMPTGPLTMRLLNPSGTAVATATVTPAQLAQTTNPQPGEDCAMTVLPVSVTPTAAATYTVELSSADPHWAVTYQRPGPVDSTQMSITGTPVADHAKLTFDVRAASSAEGTATWQLTVSGADLQNDFTYHSNRGRTLRGVGFQLPITWPATGDTSTFPFWRMWDDRGQYITSAMLQRRPIVVGGAAFELGANSDWAATKARSWIQLSGQSGTAPKCDLKLQAADIKCFFKIFPTYLTMELFQFFYASDAVLTTPIAAGGTLTRSIKLTAQPLNQPVPDYYPLFTSSDTDVNSKLTSFYWERAFAFAAGTAATDWKEYLGRQLDWVDGPLRTGEKDNLLSITQDADGYVWCWNPPGTRGWPFPDPTLYDSRHFSTCGTYIQGIGRYYSWTGDSAFLSTMLPRARAAMDFYWTALDGKSGLLRLDAPGGSPAHTGRNGAPGGGYMDLLSHGHYDAATNLYFYTAALMLAELERAAGNASAGATWESRATDIKAKYNTAFWKDLGSGMGRYIQTIDADGVAHDYGAVYLNLEALSAGIADATQGAKVLSWMDAGDVEVTDNLLVYGQPTHTPVTLAAGAHSLGQSFQVTSGFAQVAAYVNTPGSSTSTVTVRLRSGAGAAGPIIASKAFTQVYDGMFLALDLPATQPAGTYTLEITGGTGPVVWDHSSGPAVPGGNTYVDGVVQPASDPFMFAVVSPYRTAGTYDIQTRWGNPPFTSRTTTRRNNFWYVWLWSGVVVPWDTEVENGGGDLYLTGFDIIARAKYLSPDDAHSAQARLKTVLQRYGSYGDRLCGGTPLRDGTPVSNEATGGPVGVDIPFPESGLAPSGFFYGPMGIEAMPNTGLTVTPKLPTSMTYASVANVAYRGHRLTIRIDHTTVGVTDQATSTTTNYAYTPGGTVHVTV